MIRGFVVTVASLAAWAALAGQAAAAERFLGVDAMGRFVEFSSDNPNPVVRGSAPAAFGGLRVIGLDSLPGGRVLGLSAGGSLFDIDPETLAVAARYDHPVAPPDYTIDGPATFTTAPDGASTLIASGRGAHRIDLASGAITTVAALRASPADGGAAALPAVDTLPDGRLTGVDWARPAIATESTPGAGLAALGDIPQLWVGVTRFSLDPSGQIGWLVTGSPSGKTLLTAVNPATGALGRPVALAEGIDAFTALGTAPGTEPVAPPGGVALPVMPARDPALPPDRFATNVTVRLPSQTRSQILRRRGLLARFTVSTRVSVFVVAQLGPRRVCAGAVELSPGARQRVAHCSSAELRLLRTAPHDRNHGRLAVSFSFHDSRGDALRRRTIKLP